MAQTAMAQTDASARVTPARIGPADAIQWLRVDTLVVDPAVQRRLNRVRVRDIVADFNVDALGVITVSQRPGGVLVVLDGQHRREALMQMGWSAQQVPCRVLLGLSRAEEAAEFRRLNNTAKPQALDLFRIRVVEGDPVAVALNTKIEAAGWTVKPGTADGSLNAVQALERTWHGAGIRAAGPHNLTAVRDTLRTITAAWGHTANAAHNLILSGLGLVYLRYGDQPDNPGLVQRLAQLPGGPAGLIGQARGLHGYRGGTVPKCLAEVVVELHNKNRRTRLLPAWRS